jgi:hypothetical protein
LRCLDCGGSFMESVTSRHLRGSSDLQSPNGRMGMELLQQALLVSVPWKYLAGDLHYASYHGQGVLIFSTYLGNWKSRALDACTSRGLCFRDRARYISRPVFFLYPYVFVADPNKHHLLLVPRIANSDTVGTYKGGLRNG